MGTDDPDFIYGFIDNGSLTLPLDLSYYPDCIIIRCRDDLVSLGNLRAVHGGLYIQDCSSLRSMGLLEIIHGPLDCQNCPSLSSLGLVKQAMGYINVSDTSISNVDNVQILPLIHGLPPIRLVRSLSPEPA